MPSHGAVAKKVREAKEQQPTLYCPNDNRCLWRVVTRHGVAECPRHPMTADQRLTAILAQREAFPPPCEHRDIDVLRDITGTFDDHETLYGRCRACRAWVVATIWMTDRPTETRLMTAAEQSRYEAMTNV